MRKLFSLVLITIATTAVVAQSPTPQKKKYNLTNRGNDHLMVQLANNSWMGMPDSISSHVKGFNRSANVYAMMDKPFKSDQRFSAALGVGVSTSAIYFKNMEVGIGGNTSKLHFLATDTLNHYKKYKLTTAYLEVPFELRFSAKPETPLKGFKAALGIKAGTLLSGATKGKNMVNKNGTAIANSTDKLKDKEYFTRTRLAATARVGYGAFSVFGAYYFSPVFKEGTTADMKLLQVGITLSGL